MNLLFALFIVALLTLGYCTDQVPTIKILENTESDVPKIEISFPDGRQDTLILHKYTIPAFGQVKDNNTCTYIGHLEKEPGASVAVTGCPGEDMEFTINSDHSQGTNLYCLSKSGIVTAIPLPHIEDFTNHTVESDIARSLNRNTLNRAALFSLRKWIKICAKGQCQPLPKLNKLRLQVVMDSTFYRSFPASNRGRQASQYVCQLMAHTQSYFLLPSLGTKIQIELKSVLKSSHCWDCESAHRGAMRPGGVIYHLAKRSKDVDLVAFLGAPRIAKRCAGIAYVGVTCVQPQGYKSSVTEKRRSVVETAGVRTILKKVFTQYYQMSFRL